MGAGFGACTTGADHRDGHVLRRFGSSRTLYSPTGLPRSCAERRTARRSARHPSTSSTAFCVSRTPQFSWDERLNTDAELEESMLDVGAHEIGMLTRLACSGLACSGLACWSR
jgi:hypothetical protein